MVRRAPLAALSLLLVTGCAGSGGLGGQDTARDPEIAELKSRVLELQRKATVDEEELGRLRQEVAELGGHPPARPALAPMPSSAGAMGTTGSAGTSGSSATLPPPAPVRPVNRPAPQRPSEPAARGLVVTPIEESDIPLPAAPQAASGTQAKRTPTPGPAGGGKPIPPPAVPIAPASGEEAAEAVPAAAQALYDRGYTLFHQGHYVDAEASFQRFLKAYPKTDLSDNAEYWIGECRYSRHDYKGALSAFRETVERYPEGNKVPDALLKAGQSLEAMGDKESARVTYREVIQRFPGTAAAAVAEERRAKIP